MNVAPWRRWCSRSASPRAGAGGAIAACSTRSCRARTTSGSPGCSAIVVLGGLGSLPGAVLGALIFGVAETHDRRLHLAGVGDAVPYVDRLRRAAHPAAGPARHPAARGRGDGMTTPHRSADAGRGAPSRRRRCVAVARRGAAARLYPVLSRRPLLPEHDHPLAGLRDRGGRAEHHPGYAGYISLGQGAFIGLGAYTVGDLRHATSAASRGCGCRSPASWRRVVAVLLGLVALRARGPSFVIITVAFLFLVQVIAVNWVSLTNGTGGPHAAAARPGASRSRTGPSTTR